ncbi:hypothetical protein [Corynebacterium cystitidis]|uniref:hypothetical protein n=1 Tax=Corynebacterium cystitidis TaxID=35757 RepID=UPI00211DC3AE|nr:hypothetical protein [Corynebacterium cystitidis]
MANFSAMRTELRQGTLHIDGLTIESLIRLELAPYTDYVLDLQFQVREGTAKTAMRVNAYDANLVTPDGEKLESTRLIDGVTNSARIPICTGKKAGLLSVSNEFFHSDYAHAVPAYEYMTGDSGMILEEEDSTIHFRCNNRDPRDQFAFEDVTGTLTLSKITPEVFYAPN